MDFSYTSEIMTNHHHPSLYKSQFWAQAFSQNDTSRNLVPKESGIYYPSLNSIAGFFPMFSLIVKLVIYL